MVHFNEESVQSVYRNCCLRLYHPFFSHVFPALSRLKCASDRFGLTICLYQSRRRPPLPNVLHRSAAAYPPPCSIRFILLCQHPVIPRVCTPHEVNRVPAKLGSFNSLPFSVFFPPISLNHASRCHPTVIPLNFILHSLHYNSVITFQTNKCTQLY
jgi:hypothetical protein